MKEFSLIAEDINIPGLSYTPQFVSIEFEKELIDIIDSNPWNLELKRRTQHYGYKYDYKTRFIDSFSHIGKMPQWLENLCDKLYLDSIFVEKPDQVIINEYMPGQGIAAHIDCVPCFSNTICSLSLASGSSMDFLDQSIKTSLYLEPRSLLILKNDARYKWKHGIMPRKSDNGIKRDRRISLTFRKIITNN